jgi:hypothetical protein
VTISFIFPHIEKGGLLAALRVDEPLWLIKNRSIRFRPLIVNC